MKILKDFANLTDLILQVTKLERDPASGNALQEISFWLNLEKALHRIEEKQQSPEVKLTLDILKHSKRFHAIVSFTNDTGKDCNVFLVLRSEGFRFWNFKSH